MRSIGPAVTREQSPAFLHNSNGRLDFPGPAHEFEQPLGNSEEQGSLECCSPWGHKNLDMTEQLKNKTQYSQSKHQVHMGFGETHT